MRLNGYDYSELVRIIDLFLESQYGEVWHRFCEEYVRQRDSYGSSEEPNVESDDTDEDNQQDN